MNLSCRTSISPSVHPSVHPSIHPSTYPSIHPSFHPFLAAQLPVRADPPEHLISTTRIATRASRGSLTISGMMLLSRAAAGGMFMLIPCPPLPSSEGSSPVMLRKRCMAGLGACSQETSFQGFSPFVQACGEPIWKSRDRCPLSCHPPLPHRQPPARQRDQAGWRAFLSSVLHYDR